MAKFRVSYVGIGGIERYAIEEAEDSYEARKEFERTHWAYHEVLRVEQLKECE